MQRSFLIQRNIWKRKGFLNTVPLRIAYSQFIIFKQQEPYVKYVANSDQMVVYDGNPIMCDATDGAITVVSESAWLLIAVLALAALLMPLLRRRRTNKDIHKWFDAVSK